ncbi:hypothetical protein L226DRAFT_570424 [Lentinus tigrinus ALCF2SS1-7]|uniref:Uncharacterized protein n=1 Tax=Lentinus tigrinus ALCF2SS1-6 TaxID=1328759 RepID=A0A5C2RY00_9APHY|nr:hypothetical protein L227DRAFT_509092 [Lentinus tigrinus ALCF2SS1-6]RPD75385.1 hypothetical protein L226DRAFT_570424 [Lentinus tigrinus ALCF2SS1-7]
MGDISVENAELIGLWFQLLATGAYLIYFPQCISVFKFSKHSTRRSSVWLQVACYLIFVSAIADQVLALVRTYQAFAVHGNVRPDPTAYYADPANSLAAAKNSFNVVLTLISDVIIVYRTFVLWSYNVYIIILPVAAILANVALGVLFIVALLRVESGNNLIRSDISVRIRYYFVLTFIVNVFCAGLICWKIWRVNSRVSRNVSTVSGDGNGGSYTSHVLEVMYQSAGFYCAHLLILIITDAVGTNAFFIFLDPVPPIAAIIFSMLIVRARRGNSQMSNDTMGSLSSPTSPARLWGGNRGSFSGRQNVSIGVTIDLERVVHTETGSLHRFGDNPDPYGSRDRMSALLTTKELGEAV